MRYHWNLGFSLFDIKKKIKQKSTPGKGRSFMVMAYRSSQWTHCRETKNNIMTSAAKAKLIKIGLGASKNLTNN